MLAVNDLTMKFGGLTAVDSVSISVPKGLITALIGPNGAGKTTFFNCVTGIYKATAGSAVFTDKQGAQHDLFSCATHRIVQYGVARTFQNIRLFSKMSVLENVLVGAHSTHSYSAFDALLHTAKVREQERWLVRHCHAILKDLHLDDEASEVAENLPYGHQKRLEIARALAAKPTLLLLDEPAAGMNSQETQKLMELIRTLKQRYDLTVFLIEHDMHFVMNLSDSVYVMDYGKLIAHGTPNEVRNNPKTIEAYLGT